MDRTIELTLEVLNEPIQTYVDPLRIQQILINLFNHEKSIRGGEKKTYCSIATKVRDSSNDGGIPEKEQSLIFERFFQGGNKMLKVRDLGLGLPFSRMLAKAHGGNLFLKESSPKGTKFVIEFPKY